MKTRYGAKRMRSTIAPEIERRGDDRERALVAHEQQLRDRARRLEPDSVQEGLRQVADERRALGEGQAVAQERPRHAHEAERRDAHHHRVERVLGTHQATVEERERGRHQQDERGRDEHERHVGRNDHGCLQGNLLAGHVATSVPGRKRLAPRLRRAARHDGSTRSVRGSRVLPPHGGPDRNVGPFRKARRDCRGRSGLSGNVRGRGGACGRRSRGCARWCRAGAPPWRGCRARS